MAVAIEVTSIWQVINIVIALSFQFACDKFYIFAILEHRAQDGADIRAPKQGPEIHDGLAIERSQMLQEIGREAAVIVVVEGLDGSFVIVHRLELVGVIFEIAGMGGTADGHFAGQLRVGEARIAAGNHGDHTRYLLFKSIEPIINCIPITYL